MRIQPVARREGFSLVEVLAAMAIFLFSMIAFGQLLQVCSNMAKNTQYTNRAHQLLESKLNEVLSGVTPLTATGDSTFNEDQDWTYSITADADGTIPNLYTVTVTVSRKTTDGDTFQRSVCQKVFDPAQKGTFTAPAAAGAAATPTGGSN